MNVRSHDASQLKNSTLIMPYAALIEYLQQYREIRNRFSLGFTNKSMQNLRELSYNNSDVTYGQIYEAIEQDISLLDQSKNSGTKTTLQNIIHDFKCRLESVHQMTNSVETYQVSSSILEKPAVVADSEDDLKREAVEEPQPILTPEEPHKFSDISHSTSFKTVYRKEKKIRHFLTKAELGGALGIVAGEINPNVVAGLITEAFGNNKSKNNTITKLQKLYGDTPDGSIITINQFNNTIRGTVCYDDDKPKLEELKRLIKQKRDIDSMDVPSDRYNC